MPETVAEVFGGLADEFDPDAWGAGDAVLAFVITGEGGGNWLATIQGSDLSLSDGTTDAADMTMTCAAEDLLAMTSGELNAVSAFMQGKVKIDGNMSLAMKLQGLLGV